MEKAINLIVFLAITYPLGIILGVIFHILRILKVISVLHWGRFPHWQRKIILVSNHPSLLEPVLLPLLFFREYLFYPLKFVPWSTPDQKNFYDPWYWFWLRPRMIPIDRSSERKELQSLFQMKRILNSGGIIILFAEGGRTYLGESFLYSQKGKRIRILKGGLGWLVLKTKATVLPVWIEGADKFLPPADSPDKLFSWPNLQEKVAIKIGKPLKFEGSPAVGREMATQMVANALLKLADEEE
ncbi:MAG: lysophospholipid acyltransferase family protein [Patescibacteria group bacterium]